MLSNGDLNMLTLSFWMLCLNLSWNLGLHFFLRCLSAKEGQGLEVFAYALIWRSARLSLHTEGRRVLPSGCRFETKQLSSLPVMELKMSSREKHEYKMSNNSPSPSLASSLSPFPLKVKVADPLGFVYPCEL